MQKLGLVAVVLVLAVFGYGIMRAFAGAGGGTVSVRSPILEVGSSSPYYIYWRDGDSPAADTINYGVAINFDPAIIGVSGCAGDANDSDSSCEQPDEGSLIFRSTSGDVPTTSNTWTLGQMNISCRAAGTSPIFVSIPMWDSSTSQAAPTAQHGQITCVDSLPKLRIASATAAPGETVELGITSIGVPEPGVGAWTIDAQYDPAALAMVACAGAQGSVCSTAYSVNSGRLTGANANGLEGDTLLGTFSFRCERLGTSEVTLTTNVFSDATVGNPQPIDNFVIENGTITCAEPTTTPTPRPVTPFIIVDGPPQPPKLGGGPGGSSDSWWPPAVLLAGGAALAMGGAYAVQRRRRHWR